MVNKDQYLVDCSNTNVDGRFVCQRLCTQCERLDKPVLRMTDVSVDIMRQHVWFILVLQIRIVVNVQQLLQFTAEHLLVF